MATMLELRKLRVKYGDFLAVDSADISVAAGEIVGIIGPNGAGKTSILNSAAGVVTPISGEILFEGEILRPETPDRRLARGIVVVPEIWGVFPMMSVHENMLLGAYLCRDRVEIGKRMEHVFKLFPILRERMSQLAGTLSGGQQQMVAVASGLMANPRLLILDEPSIGLAPVIIKEIGRTLQRLRDEGVTIFLSEQNAKLTTSISDRIYVLQAGRIQMTRATTSLLDDPGFVEAFLSLS
jgi:branched-chain amino acid transport system ATP-binding protein